MDGADEQGTGGPQANASPDRRSFMKAAGALGLAGVASQLAAAAQAPSAASAGEAGTPPKLKGLSPKGMVDGRWPITYQDSVPTAVKVLTDYFQALGERNLQGMGDVLHFPFGSYEGTEPAIVQSMEDLLAHAPPSMNMSESPERFTDHDGYLKPGAYDVLDGIEVFNADPIRVNLSMSYNRYGSDGKRLLRCDGIYCVTNNDGKWAIQLMSTIFTPSDMVGVVYRDTEQACQRLRWDHCQAFVVNDADVLTRTRQFGTQASISAGSYPMEQSTAIAGNFMDIFRTKGVKTRLVVRQVSEESLQVHSNNPNFSKNLLEMTAKIGHGVHWGFGLGTPFGSRVVHATVDKAHVYTGVTRFTTAGEEISTTMELDVVTYKKGHWGITGSPLTFAYITTHDRVNDL